MLLAIGQRSACFVETDAGTVVSLLLAEELTCVCVCVWSGRDGDVHLHQRVPEDAAGARDAGDNPVDQSRLQRLRRLHQQPQVPPRRLSTHTHLRQVGRVARVGAWSVL
eukprot:1353435-Rhodomonas_salina.2